MKDKKEGFNSPDLTKLQAVVIDERTTIYVHIDSDPKEAKDHYLFKMREKEKGYKYN